jgi:predicted nucleotidyltransferase
VNRIEALTRRRTELRKKTAEECVSRILVDAKDRGVEISVVGSLAKERFRLHSDVDLLVHGSTSPSRRAMVERLVADRLRGTEIPYDLIFASDISSEQVRELLDASV